MRGLDNNGRGDFEIMHPRQHAHAVKVRHDEIENNQRDGRSACLRQARQGLLTAFYGLNFITEPLGGGLEQTALYRIVIGNENDGGH